MNPATMLFERLNKAFDLYNELAAHLSEPAFGSKLANLPSNTIGEQLWCVVGARESYVRGIQKGEWAGFSCSLRAEDVANKKSVSEALSKSAENARQILSGLEVLSPAQEKLAFDFLEHEIQHQGQLIRYLYGLKLGTPAGLKARYHLD